MIYTLTTSMQSLCRFCYDRSLEEEKVPLDGFCLYFPTRRMHVEIMDILDTGYDDHKIMPELCFQFLTKNNLLKSFLRF